MKAITLHQPWATLVAIGAKKIETRSWCTNYRGPLAIHAGMSRKYLKGRDRILDEDYFDTVLVDVAMPLGCIVATCELVDIKQIDIGISFPACRSYHQNRHHYWLTKQERAFGDYSVGRFMWLLENVHILDRPIPARGYQGFWEWKGDDHVRET